MANSLESLHRTYVGCEVEVGSKKQKLGESMVAMWGGGRVSGWENLLFNAENMTLSA